MVQAGKVWVPSVEDIVVQHRDIIARSGGEQGILNPSLLHAAVARARGGPFSEKGGVLERCALLLRGIAQDHPFVDGNKRTAFVVIGIMLDRNGFELTEDPREISRFILHVATGDYALEEMILWLHRNARKV